MREAGKRWKREGKSGRSEAVMKGVRAGRREGLGGVEVMLKEERGYARSKGRQGRVREKRGEVWR